MAVDENRQKSCADIKFAEKFYGSGKFGHRVMNEKKKYGIFNKDILAFKISITLS